MIRNISTYIFLMVSPLCLYVSIKESVPYNYYYLLLTIWFLYMFINQKATLEKTYVKTENLALIILDIAVGFIPLIGYAIIYVFNEKSINLLITLMMMICLNVFIKLFLVKNEKKST